MSDTSSFMHRWINDISMTIVLACALAMGLTAWGLFYRKKTNPDTVAQMCSAISTSTGKPTRVFQNQCQLEITTNQWHMVKLN